MATIQELITASETKAEKSLAQSTDHYCAAIEILRQYDVFYVSHQMKSNLMLTDFVMDERYRYGWLSPISKLMSSSMENELVTFKSHSFNKQWADSVIQVYGKIQLIKRLIILDEIGLVKLEETKKGKFRIRYTSEQVDVEHYERENFKFVNSVIRHIKSDEYSAHISKYKKILKEIGRLVQNPYGEYISYHTTPEIDAFYRKLGYFHLITSHGYEDFGESDNFGGIPYRDYLNVVEDIFGIALKHKDFCLSLLSKSTKTDPYNIFTYSWHYGKTIGDFASNLGGSFHELEKIFSCLTLSPDNIDSHSNDYGNHPPPYFAFGINQVTRSIAGSLNGSINFLKKELKRRYPSDYFKAVNNREVRFRKDLYLFFQDDRFIKLDKEIIIRGDNFSTDIDALIYDTATKTLGVFQLKWQDSYTTSLKERFSRITNLYPKSVEWIDKVERWFRENSLSAIIKGLGLEQYGVHEIGSIYNFVLARNHMYFTNEKLNDRAAWSSWYQLVQSKTTIKVNIDNPIEALFLALKLSSPSSRILREDYPKIAPYKIELDNLALYYQP